MSSSSAQRTTVRSTGCFRGSSPPKYIEVAMLAVICFRGDKLYNEHIYWDQATVLVQIGLLDPQRRRGYRRRASSSTSACRATR